MTISDLDSWDSVDVENGLTCSNLTTGSWETAQATTLPYKNVGYGSSHHLNKMEAMDQATALLIAQATGLLMAQAQEGDVVAFFPLRVADIVCYL